MHIYYIVILAKVTNKKGQKEVNKQKKKPTEYMIHIGKTIVFLFGFAFEIKKRTMFWLVEIKLHLIVRLQSLNFG